jgi:hypothetical protein
VQKWWCASGCTVTKRCLNIYNAIYTGPGTTTADSCPSKCTPGFVNLTVSLSSGVTCVEQPSCPQCDTGTYNTLDGSTNCTAVPTCPDGQYTKGATPTNPGTCTPCQGCTNGHKLIGCSGLSPGMCTRCTNL